MGAPLCSAATEVCFARVRDFACGFRFDYRAAGNLETKTDLGPLWLLIHEAIAIPLWFVLGMLIDTGRAHLGRVMSIYMAARFGFGILDAALGLAQFFILVQFLFWLWLTGYGFVHGVNWLARKVGLRSAAGHFPASPKF